MPHPVPKHFVIKQPQLHETLETERVSLSANDVFQLRYDDLRALATQIVYKICTVYTKLTKQDQLFDGWVCVVRPTLLVEGPGKQEKRLLELKITEFSKEEWIAGLATYLGIFTAKPLAGLRVELVYRRHRELTWQILFVEDMQGPFPD